MVRKAEELCAKNGWFLCHQFENEAKRVAVRNEISTFLVDGGLSRYPDSLVDFLTAGSFTKKRRARRLLQTLRPLARS